MVMDHPALWVRPLVTVQFRIVLSMGSSIYIFQAAYREFETRFFAALVGPADALKTAAGSERPTFVLVRGFQVTPDLVTKSKNIRRQSS